MHKKPQGPLTCFFQSLQLHLMVILRCCSVFLSVLWGSWGRPRKGYWVDLELFFVFISRYLDTNKTLKKCFPFILWTCFDRVISLPPCYLPPCFRVFSGSVKPATWRPTLTGSTDWVTWWPLRSVWYVVFKGTVQKYTSVLFHFSSILHFETLFWPFRVWYK